MRSKFKRFEHARGPVQGGRALYRVGLELELEVGLEVGRGWRRSCTREEASTGTCMVGAPPTSEQNE